MKTAISLYVGRKIKGYEIIVINEWNIVLFNENIGRGFSVPISSLPKPNLEWLTKEIKNYI